MKLCAVDSPSFWNSSTGEEIPLWKCYIERLPSCSSCNFKSFTVLRWSAITLGKSENTLENHWQNMCEIWHTLSKRNRIRKSGKSQMDAPYIRLEMLFVFSRKKICSNQWALFRIFWFSVHTNTYDRENVQQFFLELAIFQRSIIGDWKESCSLWIFSRISSKWRHPENFSSPVARYSSTQAQV